MSKTYTHLEVEAALCIWECLDGWTLNDDGARPEWVKFREDFGSVELRARSVEIAGWLLKVYDVATEKSPDCFYAHSYDWEVVPAILANLHPSAINPYSAIHGDLSKYPDPAEAADRVVARFARENWVGIARQAAGRLWAYTGLIADCDDYVDDAIASGEKPEEFAKRVGEKLDLIPASEW